jgi:hypothetical protein
VSELSQKNWKLIQNFTTKNATTETAKIRSQIAASQVSVRNLSVLPIVGQNESRVFIVETLSGLDLLKLFFRGQPHMT